MFDPLMHAVKCLQAEFVIYDHCTGTVKKKNRSMSTSVISRANFTCPAWPGRFLGLTFKEASLVGYIEKTARSFWG